MRPGEDILEAGFPAEECTMASQTILLAPAPTVTSTATEVPRRKAWRSPWYVLGILFLLWTVSYLDRQVLGLLVAPIRADLDLSDFQISLLQGFSFAICYAIAGLPLGWLVDHYPRRLIVFAGVTIWGIAAAASGLASSFGQLFAARMLVGIGEAALSPAAYSTLADTFPRHRLSLAISIAAMGGALGSGLAFTVSGAILSWTTSGELVLPFISHLQPWQQVFIATGTPGLVIGLLVFTFPEPLRKGAAHPAEPATEAAPTADTSTRAFLRELRRNARFYVAHMGGFTMFSIANYAFLSWAAEYMRRRFAWSALDIGATFGPSHSAAVFGAFLLGGFTVDRFFGRGLRDAHLRIFMLFALVSIPLSCWTMLTPNPYAFLIVSAVWGLFTISFGGGAAAALQIVGPAQFRGRLSSLYLVVVVLSGMTIGPSSVAAITQFVLRDEARLGTAILSVMLVSYPLGALLLASGLKPMRRALAEQAAG